MSRHILTLASLAAALLSANAVAQEHAHQHEQAPTQTQSPPPASDAHAQHRHGDSADQAATQQPADHTTMDHATMDHAAMGHTPPAEPVDHAAMGHAMPRVAGEPLTPIPPVTDADRVAATRPASGHPAHDDGLHSFVLFNRLEGFDADEGRGVEWEGQAWIGTDHHKLWLRSEGERAGGHTESADIEVLYGRAITPWWDVVAGVRHDFKPGASQDFAAIGVVGLAPYKFEVEATAYVGQGGQSALRLEAEYETLLSNRLILQPLVELNAYGQDDARRGIGSGLSSMEAGLRLRYEVTRQFAPYVGVVREWSFGRTADLRREEGEAVNDTRLVAGIRIWF
ncbi:copper resistance protein B [Lysobacter solisilvae (ex Woo and Kim 2020)]|uniref:Copper resistance protein B n=1 Tax=Agrilutibacter terrestris TaxID=2865112 RepID=A0A7H0G0C3_9GAMM|nr:copper resistance protein B [Lysobacter terrestris]QNP41739.1 copper resistance protein B [Lysobacter terrestris]